MRGGLAEATLFRAENPDRYAEALRFHQKCEGDIWEMRGPNGVPLAPDQLSRDMDKAKADLERECRPLLRALTFKEFIWPKQPTDA